jgi:hypothetical protein
MWLFSSEHDWATANSYTPPTGDAIAAGTHTYTRKVRDATCSTTPALSTGSWVLKVIADPTITIAAAQTICYNTAGSALTATVSGGSGANTYTWKWGTTTACSDGTSSSTGNTLATGNLTASRYYMVMTTQAVSGCASSYSGTVLDRARTVQARQYCYHRADDLLRHYSRRYQQQHGCLRRQRVVFLRVAAQRDFHRQ